MLRPVLVSHNTMHLSAPALSSRSSLLMKSTAVTGAVCALRVNLDMPGYHMSAPRAMYHTNRTVHAVHADALVCSADSHQGGSVGKSARVAIIGARLSVYFSWQKTSVCFIQTILATMRSGVGQ